MIPVIGLAVKIMGRTQRVTDENDTGLSIAELVARGWIYED